MVCRNAATKGYQPDLSFVVLRVVVWRTTYCNIRIIFVKLILGIYVVFETLASAFYFYFLPKGRLEYNAINC